MHSFRLLSLALVLVLIAGCEESIPEPVPADTWLPLKVGQVEIKAQLAVTSREQQKGLMHRESLPENSGMLFPYKTPQRLSFWMLNTPLPLDIGFFDGKGVLREVHRLMPFDVTPVRSKTDELQFALEMEQGWFIANGVKQGQALDLDKLRKALLQRGADPAQYGL
jgi:hypothetical protein